MGRTEHTTREATPSRRRDDYGFFGPGSPTWEVWTHPTAYIGFQRAVVIETLDPFLAAAVNHVGGIYTNPSRRIDRTAQYFLTVAVGDGRSVIEASDTIMRVHARAVGIEPVTGRPFSANDPDSQLWILVTAWHSILYCYERFGPGPLSRERELRYWEECAIAAELQTIDVTRVPRSRAAVREYLMDESARLALSADGHALFHYLLRPGFLPSSKVNSIMWNCTRFATTATLPKWMRRMAGCRQSRLTDAVVTVITRLAVRLWSHPRRMLWVLRYLSPSGHPLLAEALLGEPPRRQEVVTPAQARAEAGPAVVVEAAH